MISKAPRAERRLAGGRVGTIRRGVCRCLEGVGFVGGLQGQLSLASSRRQPAWRVRPFDLIGH
jgi:hypothetical protein